MVFHDLSSQTHLAFSHLLLVHSLTCGGTGSYTSVLAWAMVDLVFGLIAASLPVLMGLLPKQRPPRRQLDTHRSNNAITQEWVHDGAYLRSTTHTVVTAIPNHRTSNGLGDSDSDMQGIMVQDEIELSSNSSMRKVED